MNPHKFTLFAALVSLAYSPIYGGGGSCGNTNHFPGKEWRRRKSRLAMADASRKRNRR
jgi:hypothetical protein